MKSTSISVHASVAIGSGALRPRVRVFLGLMRGFV